MEGKSATGPRTAPKISVVVPVYNPGPLLEPLVDSIRRQTLPASEFEVVLVDDGSTDGSGDLVDRLAQEMANVRTCHIANSGWPGRPRNVGLDEAEGEFVFFVDQDDFLGVQALDRAYRHAVAFGSDVLVVKEVGEGRDIPFDLFRETRPSAAIHQDPIFEMLTPHKVFRRSFLVEQGLRFPEGRRRLEDHLFVVTAYFRAGVISVLADYDYYHWTYRKDATSASRTRIDPIGYFGNMEEVLDVVEAHTPPGTDRDRLLRRWYAGKVLQRLGGRTLLRMDEAYREHFFEVTRDLARRRFGPGVDAVLPPHLRVRSALLRAGQLDALVRLAGAERGTRASVRLEDLRWRGRHLVMDLDVGLEHADGRPVTFTVDGGPGWIPPVPLDPLVVTPTVLDATSAVAGSTLDGAVRGRRSHAVYACPTWSQPVRMTPATGVGTPRLRGTVRLDPTRAMGGRRLPTTADVLVSGTLAGRPFTVRVGAVRSDAVRMVGARVVGRREVAPYWTRDQENLSIATRPAQARRSRTVLRRLLAVVGKGDREPADQRGDSAATTPTR